MKYLVNYLLALIMQLKDKVASKGQGQLHFTTEQDIYCIDIVYSECMGIFYCLWYNIIVSYGGKGYKNI